MNGLQYTYRFTGPADQGVLIKNRGNNAIINNKRSMPQKFSPSAGDSMFSRARHTYSEDAGGGTLLSGHYDASQLTYLKKVNAIGKSSMLKNTVSFQGNPKDTTVLNSSLARVRGGGCTAPKKKGAIANTFKSGGSSTVTASGNRQIFA
jgi:hypothetical protein